MKIDLIQGSDSWKNFRRTHVAASEISAIVGENPWLDANTLWKRKLALIPEQELNDNMRRGTELEPIARELYCNKVGIVFTPEVHVSDIESWAMASLDGISPCGKEVLEIKCPAKQISSVPKHYLPQIHFQLFCSGAQVCHFVSFVEDSPENEKMRIFLIERADVYIEKLVEAGREFFHKLMSYDEPSVCEKEIVEVDDEISLKLADEYFNTRERIRQLEEQNESIKSQLIQRMPAKRCRLGSLVAQQVEVQGRINYSSIPELQGRSLEEFRGPKTVSWRIA